MVYKYFRALIPFVFHFSRQLLLPVPTVSVATRTRTNTAQEERPMTLGWKEPDQPTKVYFEQHPKQQSTDEILRNKKKIASLYFQAVRRNISNARKSVLSGYRNTEKCGEKRGRRPSFLTTSRCLDILMKHSSECLI